MNVTNDQLLTVHQMAEIIQRRPSTILRWARERKIPFIKIGQTIRFDRDQVVEELTEKAKTV